MGRGPRPATGTKELALFSEWRRNLNPGLCLTPSPSIHPTPPPAPGPCPGTPIVMMESHIWAWKLRYSHWGAADMESGSTEGRKDRHTCGCR